MTRSLTATQYDALTWLAKSGSKRPRPCDKNPIITLYVRRLVTRVRRADWANRYDYFITADGVTALRETDRARKGADVAPPATPREFLARQQRTTREASIEVS